jgi:hypothetical protein
MHEDINIRASRFLLGRTVRPCRHCRAATPVFALVVPPGHLALEFDGTACDDASAVDTWRVAADNAFVFHVEYLCDGVRHRLRQFTQSYRPTESLGFISWANHCAACARAFNDEELYCEPGDAFLPTSESSARLIQLLPIDQAFEAAAAGYAHEPQFFECMS